MHEMSITRGYALRRALLYFAWILAAMLACVMAEAIVMALGRSFKPPKAILPVLSPSLIAWNDLPLLAAALIATWMSLPRASRNMADFLSVTHLAGSPGLALRGGFVGLSAIAALNAILWVTGRLFASGEHVEFNTLDVAALALYVPAFIIVAMAEEIMLRGALLAWLSRAMGFLPALLLSSTIFGVLHLIGGDPWWGAVSAGCIGFVFGMTLRATGTLWYAIGFHAAWDYGQSALLGCRDSGLASQGALLNSTPLGSPWLSGGAAGPEGSVLCFVIMGLLFWRFKHASTLTFAQPSHSIHPGL